jgi:glycosyltransferase involved in cell wall biosynthesis
MKNVSIVIPLFNEEGVVDELIKRLKHAVNGLNYSFEFIIVDDGSNDKTLEKLLVCKNSEHRLKILKLSKNWGQQNSYNAGLDNSGGDAVILMDGDLEDPPEIIHSFLEKWEDGYDVVYGVKESRKVGFFSNI